MVEVNYKTQERRMSTHERKCSFLNFIVHPAL